MELNQDELIEVLEEKLAAALRALYEAKQEVKKLRKELEEIEDNGYYQCSC